MVSQETNKPRRFKVVLIYMVEDKTKKQVADLYEQLQACDIDVFMFSKDMPAVESHVTAMEDQIRDADSVIICYSDNFKKKKGYRHREVRTALDEQKNTPPGYAYLITVCLEECQVPRYLSQARVLHYFRQDHFEGIMRWGLLVQRKKLLEDGENIQAFKYHLPQEGDSTEETILQENGPSPTNKAGSSSVWNVPHARNPHFTGRDELLDQLHQRLTSTGQNDPAKGGRVALTQPQAIKGLGGIGKTQIAVEYAYRSHDLARYTHTLWVNAANKETIITSFDAIAELLPSFYAKDETDHQKLVEAIKRWLERCEQRWLLIFDNADDLSLIKDYLPQQSNGSVLLTTRDHAVGSLASSIEVKELADWDAIRFLLRRAQSFELVSLAHVSDEEVEKVNEAENIVIALDRLPLALDQAGAYIEETGCSLADYLQCYNDHRKDILAMRGKQNTAYPDSVATTWSLSFQKVEQSNPAAAELLRLCAFLAPDNIPDELIIHGAKQWSPLLQQSATDLFTFNNMMKALLKYSLVNRLSDNKTFSMHRLVQAVQIDSLELAAQRQWAERAVRAVNVVFPNKPEVTGTWPRCLRYLDQVQACNSLMGQYMLSFTEGADLLNRTGVYLERHALYNVAEPLYKRALSIREEQLGTDHLDVASSLSGLAELYREQGKYGEAKPLCERALSIREQQLGPEHPDTAISLNDLALVYWDQGKYEQAETLYKRVLSIDEQHLGSEHPDRAVSLSNMALLYCDQGKYEQAEPLYKQALSIQEQQLGPEDPDVATSLSNLALLYTKLGKYEQAEPLYKRALSICEQHLGPKHPYMATSLNNLALLYSKLGKYEQAEPLYRRALSIQEQQLGPEHPDIGRSLNNLATFYLRQGKYEQAEPLYKRALSIYEQHLGPGHPKTAYPLMGLADLYAEQKKYVQALPLCQRVLAIRNDRLGPDHPETLNARKLYASLLRAIGKDEEIQEM